MNLEQQACSLELAKKLKELGMKQESVWYWVEGTRKGEKVWSLDTGSCGGQECSIADEWIVKGTAISAFTVAELGEMLPKSIQYSHNQVTADVMEGRGDWYWTTDIYLGPDKGHHTENADTETDARAKMLCYLIENKLIQVDA